MLQSVESDIAEAAKILGVSKTTLEKKINKYKVDYEKI